jgi:hypothetical protein
MVEFDDTKGRPVNDNIAKTCEAKAPHHAPLPAEPMVEDGVRAIRCAILAQLRRGAGFCRDRTETPYQARERFARLCEVARNVDRLATAGVILLRQPIG